MDKKENEHLDLLMQQKFDFDSNKLDEDDNKKKVKRVQLNEINRFKN